MDSPMSAIVGRSANRFNGGSWDALASLMARKDPSRSWIEWFDLLHPDGDSPSLTVDDVALIAEAVGVDAFRLLIPPLAVAVENRLILLVDMFYDDGEPYRFSLDLPESPDEWLAQLERSEPENLEWRIADSNWFDFNGRRVTLVDESDADFESVD